MNKFNLKCKFLFAGTVLFLMSSCAIVSKSGKYEKKSEGETTSMVENAEKNNVEEGKANVNNRKAWVAVYSGDDEVLKWKLKTINDQKADNLYTNIPVLRFDEIWNQIYGSAECNRYTGYYQKNENTISLDRFTITDRKCEDDNEGLFFDTLNKVNEIKESAEEITLLKDGKEVLVFDKY